MAVPPAQTSPDPRARLDLFKTLGDNTRYAIYLEKAGKEGTSPESEGFFAKVKELWEDLKD